MDYREHPRTPATETLIDGVIGKPGSRSRFRRFEFRRNERQLDWPRVLLAGLLFLGMLSVVGYIGLIAVRSAIQWLHRQPQYQIPFREIRLQPEPPPWYRGGSEGFLKQVREKAQQPELLAVLDVDRERLMSAFRDYSPWVEDARITFSPQLIRVELSYKRPVAIQKVGSGEDLFLDRHGHLLPGEDVDRELLGPLIKITGPQLVPSAENRPGGIWKSGLAGPDAPRVENCVRGAAGLAGFLQERSEETSGIAALRVDSIYANEPHKRGLFLLTAEQVLVLWGDPPGMEKPGMLEASEKWEIMKKWAATTGRRELSRGGFWMFGRSDLQPIEPGVTRP